MGELDRQIPEDTKVINHGDIRIELNSDGSIRVICDNYMQIQPRTSNSCTIKNIKSIK